MLLLNFFGEQKSFDDFGTLFFINNFRREATHRNRVETKSCYNHIYHNVMTCISSTLLLQCCCTRAVCNKSKNVKTSLNSGAEHTSINNYTRVRRFILCAFIFFCPKQFYSIHSTQSTHHIDSNVSRIRRIG